MGLIKNFKPKALGIRLLKLGGYALGNLALAFVLTKGADKVVKAGKVVQLGQIGRNL
jgi:hypothetical protein